ncbi:MAG: MaoC family dehydratase [bacterium]
MEPGRTYEELSIGDRASAAKTISESDVYGFAGITGDFNPVHVNEEFARRTPFGTRIAHGGLSAGLAAPVLGMKLPGLGTVVTRMNVWFRAPVRFGDTITCAAEVVEKNDEKKRVKMKLTWTNQRGEEVMGGEASVIPPTAEMKKAFGGPG